jgi:hypothetical protein
MPKKLTRTPFYTRRKNNNTETYNTINIVTQPKPEHPLEKEEEKTLPQLQEN